ncbi:hypothetical protein BAE44_0005732 [Dichanthelium oligosanthes]|uniref:CCHC-type domain-containing protein n=1 Tax=Dichanthelium oligosanthes TaxID=888268 RepID=A0A1E5W758_9POAL|nr:hypothetical protein BAE44_0005732 [Dichanthelium oligosanthes]
MNESIPLSIVSSPGTISTAYTSTATTSTTTSSGFHPFFSPIERQAMKTARRDVLTEAKMEERHLRPFGAGAASIKGALDGLVQEFFGAPPANCSIKGGAISVLERWFIDVDIPWVLHLADPAAAGELERTFSPEERDYAVLRWIMALTEIMETSHSARSLFPDRSSQHARFTQEIVLIMLPFVDLIVIVLIMLPFVDLVVATTDEAFLSERVDVFFSRSRCPRWSSYSGGAQQESDEEDDQEVVKNERRRYECFNCGKKRHLARDCWSARRHSEGNVATMKELVLEGYEEEEEEWDAEGGFSMEMRDLDTSNGCIVFGYDSDKDLEALSDEEEDNKDDKIEPSPHEDDGEPQEHGKDAKTIGYP